MRAKFVFEKFKEDSDPVKDMGIGLIHHIQNIEKALMKMEEPEWEEIDYIEDEYVMKLDSRQEYVEPDDFFDSVNFKKTWSEIGVIEPFEIIYYFDIDLNSNSANRVFCVKNSNIEDWEWFDQKILSKDPISLSAEEITKLIFDDWIGYDNKAAALEAYEMAEAVSEKTIKRINTY